MLVASFSGNFNDFLSITFVILIIIVVFILSSLSSVPHKYAQQVRKEKESNLPLFISHFKTPLLIYKFLLRLYRSAHNIRRRYT
jgi:hypothetical protein